MGPDHLAVANLPAPALALVVDEGDVPAEMLQVQPETALLGTPEVARSWTVAFQLRVEGPTLTLQSLLVSSPCQTLRTPLVNPLKSSYWVQWL